MTRGLDDPLHPISEAFAGACRELGYPEQLDKNAPGPLGYPGPGRGPGDARCEHRRQARPGRRSLHRHHPQRAHADHQLVAARTKAALRLEIEVRLHGEIRPYEAAGTDERGGHVVVAV